MDEDIGHLVLIKEEATDDGVANSILGVTSEEESINDISGEPDPLCAKLEDSALPRVKEELLDDTVETVAVKNEEAIDPSLDGSSSEYSISGDFNNDERVDTPKVVKKKSRSREKRYSCNFCDYICVSSMDLKRHTRIHTGEKPYKCEICGSRFTQACHKKVHMRTHTGEKQFECDGCGFKCNRASNLKIHKLRAHTALKPYSCEVCGQRFKLRGDLDRHVRTHTGEKPYLCDICDSKFTQAGHLRVHMRIHTGEKPFACELCNYKCTRPKRLKTHMFKFHSLGGS